MGFLMVSVTAAHPRSPSPWRRWVPPGWRRTAAGRGPGVLGAVSRTTGWYLECLYHPPDSKAKKPCLRSAADDVIGGGGCGKVSRLTPSRIAFRPPPPWKTQGCGRWGGGSGFAPCSPLWGPTQGRAARAWERVPENPIRRPGPGAAPPVAARPRKAQCAVRPSSPRCGSVAAVGSPRGGAYEPGTGVSGTRGGAFPRGHASAHRPPPKNRAPKALWTKWKNFFTKVRNAFGTRRGAYLGAEPRGGCPTGRARVKKNQPPGHPPARGRRALRQPTAGTPHTRSPPHPSRSTPKCHTTHHPKKVPPGTPQGPAEHRVG